MRNKETARLRAAWIPRGKGEVLEIVIGSGLNLPFYSSEVKHVFGVDPSLELQRMAQWRIGRQVDVDFLTQSAQQELAIRQELKRRSAIRIAIGCRFRSITWPSV